MRIKSFTSLILVLSCFTALAQNWENINYIDEPLKDISLSNSHGFITYSGSVIQFDIDDIQKSEVVFQTSDFLFNSEVLDDSILVVSSYSEPSDSLYLTFYDFKNNTFTQKPVERGFISLTFLEINDSTIILGGGGGRILISKNHGQTWERIITPANNLINDGLLLNTNIISICYGSFNRGGMAISHDGGVTWDNYDLEKNITSISYNGQDEINLCSIDGTVLQYTVSTMNFQELYNQPNTSLTSIENKNATSIFCGGLKNDSTYILTSDDNGKTWIEIYKNDFNYLTSQCLINGKNLFFGTFGGELLKYRDLTSTNDMDLGVELVIYPNPTSNRINIKSENAVIKDVSIFNQTGSIESIISNQNQHVDGINVSHLNKGTYYLLIMFHDDSYLFQPFIKL